MQESIKSKISGVASFLPDRVVTNYDLEKIMDTTHDWIVQRTGIVERRWVEGTKVTTSDLAYEASLRALADAKIDKSAVDMILLATLSPDHEFPGTACFLQAKLGLSEIPAIDIRQQCSGFIYALSIGDLFIKSGRYKNILVVGSELQSRGLDKSTEGRDVTVLFGDGAGAVVLSRATEGDHSNILSTHIHADGQFAKELWVPAPGLALGDDARITEGHMKEKLHYPRMNGKAVYVHAVKRMIEGLHECCDHNQLNMNDVDLFLFHQANLRIVEGIVDRLKLPPEKVFNTIERFANTTAATLPIGMDYAIKENRLKRGMLVALSTFGSGFTWGSALLRY
ncbi:MAG: ketoacyl-ACP synthase III [Oligoflexia bacterium]|nr:ketoacyl-ACP synthase III [Oligoflexia bacterium]MBF0366677.1 ketoacyl-ACP synthase III [Oligoflexia bacterium]